MYKIFTVMGWICLAGLLVLPVIQYYVNDPIIRDKIEKFFRKR